MFAKPQATKPPFQSLYSKISGFERQIDLDIERTLRDHVLFRTRFGQAQVSLFKILVAYSNHDPQVGYCQGMSTVAAFLLMYFDEEVE
jgi:USP6 N-terminal-like protein